MRFVDPKTDIAFKKIFGSSEHKIVLIEFLNAVLELEYLIVDVTILNPYQAPKIIGLKETILDVRAKDQKGREFIVEMQVEKDTSFYKRAIYYSSKAYVQQIAKGENYKRLKPVIFIGILDFQVFESENYLSKHLILNVETQEHSLKDLEFNFIELAKFNKKEEELESLVEKWVYFLKHAYSLETVPSSADTEGLKQAYEIANQYGWNQKELDIYEYQEMQKQKLESVIETSHEEGKVEGEKSKQLEIAKNLLVAKVDIAIISQGTGLSIEEIEEIQRRESIS